MNVEVIASKFLRIIEEQGDTIAYHSLYGNPVQIDSKVKQLLHELTVPHDFEEFSNSSDACLNAIGDLIRLGYIIPIKAATNEYEKWITNIQEIYSKETLFKDGLVLIVTTVCNLSCKYCIAAHTLPSGKTMAYPIAELALRNYISYLEINKVLHQIDPLIIFSGGEPLIQYKLIRRLCEYASKTYPNISFRFRLITNGTLIDPENAEFLKKYKFDIIVSLDGLEETNDFYRKDNNGLPTSIAILRGLKTLCQQGVDVRNLSLSAVYHEEHSKGLSKELFKLIHGLGINYITINTDNLKLMKNSPKEMARKFIALRSTAKLEGVILSGRWAVPAQILRDNKKPCAICSGAAKSKLFVQPEGGLTFCDYYPEILGKVEQLGQFAIDNQSSQSPYLFGSWDECKGCEIEGFCSPCVLEKDFIHKQNPTYQQQKCEFLRNCTRLLMFE